MSQESHQARGSPLQSDEVGLSIRRLPPVPALLNAITQAYFTSEPLSQEELLLRLVQAKCQPGSFQSLLILGYRLQI